MSHSGGSTRVIVFALLANLGIAIAKFAGAYFSGSASMLAEAIHSLVDTSNQCLLLVGSKRSQREPDDQHPLGYGREEFFWSFVVAILLFSMGGLFAIYEGVHKLSAHEDMAYPWVGLGILGVSLVLEGLSFRAAFKEMKKQNPYNNLWTWFRRTTASDLLVVLTEDAAAMAGLSIATACLVLAMVTGNPVWDAIGSILVGGVLVVVAVLLATEIKSLIVGEAPSTDFSPFLEAEIGKHLPGAKVLRLIALQLSAHEIMFALKITPGDRKLASELVDGINSYELAIRAQYPEVRWLFVEPDWVD